MVRAHVLQAQLQARPGLRAWPQQRDGRTAFVIEDPDRGAFYRLGEAEYRFLSCLDGATSLEDAARLASAAPDGRHFGDSSGPRFAHWLRQEGLLVSVDEASGINSAKRAGNAPESGGAWSGTWWSLRFPLLRSRKHLEPLERLLLVMFDPRVAWMALAIIVSAVLMALQDGARMAQGWTIAAPEKWLALAAATLVLKVMHELGHAAACRRFGGEVREAGLLLVFFAPLAYVDVSSCWRFPSRWRRMAVAAAGVYIELFWGAIAFWLWWWSSPGWVQEISRHIAMAAALTTVVLNFNPLMRFDGYYLLSDWLELPNLAQRGQQALAQRWARLMGRCCPAHHEPWTMAAYGGACLLWRGCVIAALLAALSRWAGGWGMLAVIWWIVGCLGRMWISRAAALKRPTSAIRPKLLLAAAALLAALVCAVPWRTTAHSWAVVAFDPLTSVRAGVSGFVRQVLVEDGQVVQAGQLLLVLENPILDQRCQDAELACQQEQVRIRWRRQLGDPAGAQAEQTRLESLRVQQKMLQDERERLQVRAPRAGRVMQRRLSWLPGAYVAQGSELLSLGDEGSKKLRVVITQQQYDSLRQHSAAVKFRLPDGSQFDGQLGDLQPRASRELLDPALAGGAGGPLAILVGDPHELRLLQPCFEATIPLSPQASAAALAGQRVLATWATQPRSLLADVWSRCNFLGWTASSGSKTAVQDGGASAGASASKEPT